MRPGSPSRAPASVGSRRPCRWPKSAAPSTIFERAPTLEPVGAGVQLSPNATLVLDRLGVLDALRPSAIEPSEVLMRRARDGAVLARVPLGPAARYGAPFLAVLRGDLQAVLLSRVAAHPGTALHLGRGVVGLCGATGAPWRSTSPTEARLSPPTRGSSARMGSARPSAASRRAATTPASGPARPWRAVVPRDAVDADTLLPRSNLWLGRRTHLVHYPVAGGRSVNVVGIVDQAAAQPDGDLWSQPAEAAAVARHFADWAEPARRLIAAAPGWRRWPLFDRPPLPRWSEGAVTLLGDAAHPMLPFLAQGAAQSIEDAAVLADSVARCGGDLPAAFLDYETMRRPRTSRVQAQSASQGGVYHLGPPASLARDVVLSILGPARLAARFDWLYDAPAEVRRFAGPKRSS